MIDLISEYM